MEESEESEKLEESEESETRRNRVPNLLYRLLIKDPTPAPPLEGRGYAHRLLDETSWQRKRNVIFMKKQITKWTPYKRKYKKIEI